MTARELYVSAAESEAVPIYVDPDDENTAPIDVSMDHCEGCNQPVLIGCLCVTEARFPTNRDCGGA